MRLDFKRGIGFGAICALTIMVLMGSYIAPSAYNQILNAGTKLTMRSILNFTGGGCSDNSGTTPPETDCTGGGGGGAAGATFFSSTSQAGPSNSAVETSLVGASGLSGSQTIAANTFTNGQVLQVQAQGFYSTPAVPDSLALKIKCGSTVLASASFTPRGNITNGTFRLWLNLVAVGTGAAGAFNGNGQVDLTGGSLTTAQVGAVLNTANVAFDFTTACIADVTATWGTAQAGESITGTNVAEWIPGAPVTSVNGGTGAVTTETSGPYASLPATCGSGSSYQTTDGPYRLLCGPDNTFVPYYEGLKVSVPVASSFATFNSGGTGITFTENTTGGWINIREQGSSTQGQIVGITKTKLASTFTAKFTFTASVGFLSNTAAEFGVCVTDGTQFITMMYLVFPANSPASLMFTVSKWTNATTFSTDYITQQGTYTYTGPLTFVIQETSTARNFYLSSDGGKTLSLILTTGNTDFLTTTRYGVFLRGDAAGADSNLTLISLTESNP